MNVQSVQSEKGWGKKAQFYKIALENKVDLLIICDYRQCFNVGLLILKIFYFHLFFPTP